MVLGKNHFPIQEMGVRISYSPKSAVFLFEKCWAWQKMQITILPNCIFCKKKKSPIQKKVSRNNLF